MDVEVSPIRVRSKAVGDPSQPKANLVSFDEEYSRLNLDEEVDSLPPVFEEGGTVTAASASSLNDG